MGDVPSRRHLRAMELQWLILQDTLISALLARATRPREPQRHADQLRPKAVRQHHRDSPTHPILTPIHPKDMELRRPSMRTHLMQWAVNGNKEEFHTMPWEARDIREVLSSPSP